MTFLVAWRLWLLLAVGGMVGAWVASIYRRRRDVVRFTNVALLDVVAPERPGWRRHLPAVLWLLAMTLLVVGFARPARRVDVTRDRAIVVVAVDVSLSMEAEDVEPSRFEVAKDAARDFVESLPDNADVGLVIFSGTARTLTPSQDREAVLTALAGAELAEGTAIGEAIFAGLDLISAARPEEAGAGEDGAAPGRVVVLSDGETTVGRPNDQAAAAAAAAGVPVDTIAFGTPEGEIVDPDGFTEDVPVRPGPLQDIADTTGGDFYEAASLGSLADAYEHVESAAVRSEKEKREISGWFIGLGLLLLTGAGVMSLAWSQRLP